MFDSMQIGKPIPVIAKNLLPLITSHNHMVKRPFEFHSRFSGHAGKYNGKGAIKSILRPDPISGHAGKYNGK